MKIALIPVGIDSREGRQLSPILKDGRFIFIPVPQLYLEPLDIVLSRSTFIKIKNINEIFPQRISRKMHPYKDISIEPWIEFPDKIRMGDFLQDRIYKGYPIREYIPHYDPNFDDFTYGEGDENKAKFLKRLEPKDIILFYASLSEPLKNKFQGKYLISFFEVERIYDYYFENKRIFLRSLSSDSEKDYEFRIVDKEEKSFPELDEKIKSNFHIVDPKIGFKVFNKPYQLPIILQTIIAAGHRERS